MGKGQSTIQDLIWINMGNTLVSNDPRMSQTVRELVEEQRCRETSGVRTDSTLSMVPPAQWHDKHCFGVILQNPAEQRTAIIPLYSPLLKALMEFYAQP